MDASETDEALIRRFQEGSADAFEVLVQRHGTRVYNLCFRILGDPEEAADASQDTFLAALRKLNTFRGDSAFTTWLHRVTVNACYDSLRRKRRRPRIRAAEDRRPLRYPAGMTETRYRTCNVCEALCGMVMTVKTQL